MYVHKYYTIPILLFKQKLKNKTAGSYTNINKDKQKDK